jgi:acyl-CoA synthetase (AMP-forming)/AMP-acid ligase II
VQTAPYDLAQAQAQADRAAKRLAKHPAAQQQHQALLEQDHLDKHEFNVLTVGTTRLAAAAQTELNQLAAAQTQAHNDPAIGQTVIEHTTEVLDLRKLTLLNLFKDHALIAMHLLAYLLGLDGTGPERLRREFLAHGEQVEFDYDQRRLTVFPKPFPCARTQRAYEWLCAQLNARPVTFLRDGVTYRVRFSW